MSRLRTYAPMNRRSQKVQRQEADFRGVYRQVDQRSEGRCEVSIPLGPSSKPRQLFHFAARCSKRATDHHHLLKPRRSHHTTEEIAHLCRDHHDRCQWPFTRGRLVGTILGGGRFGWTIRYAKR